MDPIVNIKSAKVSGLFVDECLTWKYHIYHATRSLFGLKQAQHLFHISHFVNGYAFLLWLSCVGIGNKSLVHPTMIL